VLVVLVLAATTFAGEIRSAVAQTILSSPLSRGAMVAGGAVGHAAFGLLLALALGAAGTLGLDLAGLGAGARGAVRPYAPVTFENARPHEPPFLGRDSSEVRAKFLIPDPLPDELSFRLDPKAQVETDFSPEGTLEVAVAPAERPGARSAWHRVPYRAFQEFEARVGVAGFTPGEEAILLLRRVDGGFRLRFVEGSVEVGGARELFGWNVVKAVLCLLPLLAMAAAAGTAASARLGAAASLVLVLFLLLLLAGRDVVLDAAAYVVEEGAAQESGHHEELPGHEHHDHTVEISPVQVALARGALVGMRAVPDAAVFWRFGDVAAGRAVTPKDLGGAAAAGVLPSVLLLGASWLLVRRRELEAG
jgi:hypothetical protein